ncbi:MAG TPA: porin [Vicinamibacterales bacterium]|nr:porin [Vicinamibacterales bacterium]
MRIGPAAVAAMMLAATLASPAAAQDAGAAHTGFTIRATGYLQLDARAFPDWGVRPGTPRLERDTLAIRRLRGGVDGAWRNTSFELSVDPFDDEDNIIKDAYLQLALKARHRIRVGQFKIPGSREYDTTARRTDFLERSILAAELAAGRDIGVRIDGRLRSFRYEAGVFAGDGVGRRERAGVTIAGRGRWEPIRGLELAMFGSIGDTTADETAAANGLDGRSAAGYRFFERVYVDGRRARFGGDAEWTSGPWRITADALRVHDQRRGQSPDYDDLPSFLAQAWTVGASRRFGDGAANGDRVERWPWQVAARYEQAIFDDVGPVTERASVRPRATDIRRRGVDTVTTGLSYQATRWLRVLSEAGLERYREPHSAPSPGRSGSYVTAGLRLQIEFR